jgi:V8-like Glu-specific endopeptidase
MCTQCGDKEMTLITELEQVLYRNPGRKFNDGYDEVQREIFGTEDARQFIPDSKVASYRYICQVEREFLNNKLTHGTVFFIGPKTILTAGHVIWDDVVNSKVTNSKIFIYPVRRYERRSKCWASLDKKGCHQ